MLVLVVMKWGRCLSIIGATGRFTRLIYPALASPIGVTVSTALHYMPPPLPNFYTTLSDQPADLIALSLGCEFAARVARDHSDQLHSLILLAPTGLSSQTLTSPPPDWIHRLLSFPLWARPLYDLLVIRSSLRYFLNQSFVGEIPAGFTDYAYAVTHQPGAEYAPLYFVSGQLFTPDARHKYYQALAVPTLILYDQDPYNDYAQIDDLAAQKANVHAQRIAPTRGLPHFEQPDATTRAIDGFWQSLT